MEGNGHMLSSTNRPTWLRMLYLPRVYSRGDRIAYLDRNAPEYFIFLFGGAKVNAVSVAVNWRLANEEMEYILNHSEATVLLIGEEYLPALGK